YNNQRRQRRLNRLSPVSFRHQQLAS
ncbi:IS3 family transposase, partial [Gottfriedia sp. NPDC058432]